MEVRRCRAQAVSMARQADAALRSLLRIQANREKQSADNNPPPMERAGYLVQGDRVARPRIATARRRAVRLEPGRTEADIDAEAELYVVMYPDRAERIRAAGGLPAHLDFGAPGPEIVARLLREAPERDVSHGTRHRRMNADYQTGLDSPCTLALPEHRKAFNTELAGHGGPQEFEWLRLPWPSVFAPC